jgi:predicted MFS family arabinose efflux permease
MALALGSASGGVLFGHAYDVFGGYRQALEVSALCLAASSALYVSLGRYPRENEAVLF